MFTKSRKDKLVDKAQDLAHDLSDKIAPAVERARDEIAPRVLDARDQLAPKVADARDSARDALAPKVADLRDRIDSTVTPRLEDARDRATGTVHQVVSDARNQAHLVRDEAERRGTLAAAALKGEPVKQPTSKRKKLLVLAVLAGAGVVVARKLAGGQQDNWQSSYTPSPAPRPAPTGSAPGESLADSAEQPHPVTTPDDPAEVVDLGQSADGTDATSPSSGADDSTK